MKRPTHRINPPVNWIVSPLNGVRQRMAKALVGQAVSLVVDARTITHGIVTDVLAEPDVPQIVVGGMRYNFNQILTNVPATFS